MTTSGNTDRSYCRRYEQTSKAVGHARRDVVDFAQASGFSGQDLADIEAAVGEGLANAFEHGQQTDGFEVSARCEADALAIEIKDRGRGFDHHTAALRTPPPCDGLRGFGIFIMRELMDDIHYTDLGTRLWLRKRLPVLPAIERSAAQA